MKHLLMAILILGSSSAFATAPMNKGYAFPKKIAVNESDFSGGKTVTLSLNKFEANSLPLVLRVCQTNGIPSNKHTVMLGSVNFIINEETILNMNTSSTVGARGLNLKPKYDTLAYCKEIIYPTVDHLLAINSVELNSISLNGKSRGYLIEVYSQANPALKVSQEIRVNEQHGFSEPSLGYAEVEAYFYK